MATDTEFFFTPDELQGLARKTATVLEGDGYRCKFEEGLPEAPMRTTICASATGRADFLIEVQGKPEYAGVLEELAHWLDRSRANVKLAIAVDESSDIPATLIKKVKADGVGLIFVGGGKMMEAVSPRVPALIVTPDPSLSLGRHKSEVLSLVSSFNDGDRKGALRDMYEVVERETDRTARKAARAGHLKRPEGDVKEMSWNDQINALGAKKGGQPVVSSKLKADLHSFRSARNELDHKARSKTAAAKREREFAERMMMGVRLVSELSSSLRKL